MWLKIIWRAVGMWLVGLVCDWKGWLVELVCGW